MYIHTYIHMYIHMYIYIYIYVYFYIFELFKMFFSTINIRDFVVVLGEGKTA